MEALLVLIFSCLGLSIEIFYKTSPSSALLWGQAQNPAQILCIPLAIMTEIG